MAELVVMDWIQSWMKVSPMDNYCLLHGTTIFCHYWYNMNEKQKSNRKLEQVADILLRSQHTFQVQPISSFFCPQQTNQITVLIQRELPLLGCRQARN